jgi:hypothetical protein
MKTCVKICHDNKEIYGKKECFDSLTELSKSLKIKVEKGFVFSKIKIHDLEDIINIMNGKKKCPDNRDCFFIPDSDKIIKRINPENHLEYEDQSKYAKKRIRNFLISNKNMTLTQIIEKSTDIKISRAGWTNHLNKTIHDLENEGFIVERIKKRYYVRQL